MNILASDPMWPTFFPLWTDLKSVADEHLLVAGGYGLFLKQTWLLAHPDVLTIVPIRQWREATPRVTGDFDFITMDLIANAETQKKVLAILEKHDFRVSERNPRWQFVKNLGGDLKVSLDLHSPIPLEGQSRLDIDRFRIKHKPSLGNKGIHARTNPEAVGCNYRAFPFELEGLLIKVPNPITWCIMKLTATRDQHSRSQDTGLAAKDRSYARKQSIKHARDVCRVVAMTTRDESDATPEVTEAVRLTPQYRNALEVASNYFQSEAGWVFQEVREAWEPADLQLIRATLMSWFK